MNIPKTFKVLYTKQQLDQIIKQLGKKITDYYSKDDKLLVFVLAEGGLIFAMDLIRNIDLPLEYHTCVVKSYGNKHEHDNVPTMCYFPAISYDDFIGKKILIVDDICDTGNSLKFVKKYIKSFSHNININDIKICTLLKNNSVKSVIDCDFVGIKTNGEWLIGYGFDQKQFYRNIKDLMYIER